MSTPLSGFTRRGSRGHRRSVLQPASSRLSGLLQLAAVFAALSGCTLLAPYDEVTDHAVTDLAIRTEATLARADAGQLSAAESEKFLSDSIGTVRALKARAGLKAKNSEEAAALGDLEQRYLALAGRNRPLRSSVATGLRATLLSVQQIQLSKKRSAAFGTGSKAAEPSP